jgi:excinuclease UvrABC ATPase subunit
MYNIETKYDIGDQVFLITREKAVNICNICEGKRKIEYKDKMMTCPECRGLGTIQSNNVIYVVRDNPFIVEHIRVYIHSKQGSYSWQYKIGNFNESHVRTEDCLCPTKELAQTACDELNKS